MHAGDHCESDFDGCQDNPCTEGTNCTDLSPSEHIVSGKTFNCSECPPGTEDNEGICLRKHPTILAKVKHLLINARHNNKILAKL